MKRLESWRLRGQRRREAWLATLVWGRLRYADPNEASRALRLLSGAALTGRIELVYTAGEVPALFLGLPKASEVPARTLLTRHGCRWDLVAPGPPAAMALLGQANQWSEQGASFTAQVVDGYLFTSASPTKPSLQPVALSRQNGHAPAGWSLPAPVLGLATTVCWNNFSAPPSLLLEANRADRWILGRSPNGVVGAGGRVSLYGQEEACRDYLVHVVLQALAAGPEQLVVIDGRGDLVRALKRQSSVAEKLRRGVMLVEMDGLAARGFDPLVAVGPAGAETETQQLTRWRRWFTGQGVAPAGLTLLEQACQEGCRDWPGLQGWVKRNQAGSFLAQSSLRAALERLTAPTGPKAYPRPEVYPHPTGSADVALWLQHSNRQAIPHQGALLFSCSDSGDSRHHYLVSVLLAALNLSAVRLVVYGFDWRGFDLVAFAPGQQLFLANGPRLAHDQMLLTAGADPSLLPVVSPEWTERLQLLAPGEGLLLPPAGSADLSSATYLHW